MAARTRQPLRDVFCLESDWSSDMRDQATVGHLLTLLKDLRVLKQPIRKPVDTKDGLLNRVTQWTQKRYSRYTVLYLASHGEPGAIRIGRDRVLLDELAEAMVGCRNGCFVHFGCCETLAVDRRHLTRFLRRTGAKLISGYTKEVDWVQSAAFELLLLNEFQTNRTPAQIASHIAKHHRAMYVLAKGLGWRMEYLRPEER